jgi:hypothetical protein
MNFLYFFFKHNLIEYVFKKAAENWELVADSLVSM